MIFFVELQMQGQKHVQVNSAFLQIVQIAFRDDDIHVICDTVHKTSLLSKLPSLKNVTFEDFNYTGNWELKKKYLFYKVFREVVLAYRLFKKAKQNGAKI